MCSHGKYSKPQAPNGMFWQDLSTSWFRLGFGTSGAIGFPSAGFDLSGDVHVIAR